MSMRQLKISNSITQRESESLSKYLLEINKLELNSPEKEVQLTNLINQGDKNALDSLVKANLRFVVSVAKQYQHQGLSLSDLINEGNIGLIKAARSFDITRGFKFISYAVWWIRQHIIHAIGENARIVRLPLNKITLKGHVQKVSLRLEQDLQRTPSPDELAEELHMDNKEVISLLGMNERYTNLDAPISGDGETSMLDLLENTNVVSTDKEVNYTGSLKVEIDRSLKSLSERQKETVCWFYGIGTDRAMSLEEIGVKLHLTTERIRQIKDKAIYKIRTGGNLNLLRSFLGT